MRKPAGTIIIIFSLLLMLISTIKLIEFFYYYNNEFLGFKILYYLGSFVFAFVWLFNGMMLMTDKKNHWYYTVSIILSFVASILYFINHLGNGYSALCTAIISPIILISVIIFILGNSQLQNKINKHVNSLIATILLMLSAVLTILMAYIYFTPAQEIQMGERIEIGNGLSFHLENIEFTNSINIPEKENLEIRIDLGSSSNMDGKTYLRVDTSIENYSSTDISEYWMRMQYKVGNARWVDAKFGKGGNTTIGTENMNYEFFEIPEIQAHSEEPLKIRIYFMGEKYEYNLR